MSSGLSCLLSGLGFFGGFFLVCVWGFFKVSLDNTAEEVGVESTLCCESN